MFVVCLSRLNGQIAFAEWPDLWAMAPVTISSVQELCLLLLFWLLCRTCFGEEYLLIEFIRLKVSSKHYFHVDFNAKG